MKKFFSVILSVVMLLSCLTVFVVSANAGTTTYTNGNSQTMYDTNWNPVAYHYISDSFYVEKECFLMYGYVRYNNTYGTDFTNMKYTYSWTINTTTSSISQKIDPQSAYREGVTWFYYVSQEVSYESLNLGSVTGITVKHYVHDDNNQVTASLLSVNYVN